jgi:hypothetical protein
MGMAETGEANVKPACSRICGKYFPLDRLASAIKKAPRRRFFYGCSQWGRISKTGSTLVRTLAWVLFAAGVRTALQADLLAAAGRDGEALGRELVLGRRCRLRL